MFCFGALNTKLLSPFFSTFQGKQLSKKFKATMMASIFIANKIIENLFLIIVKGI